MKKWIALLLAAGLCLSLCACGKEKRQEPQSLEVGSAESVSPVFEVKITLDNLYQYFEYKEFRSEVKSDNGETTSVQIAYGLALREGYTAANSPEHPDTMEITFTADGVVKHGDFDVDFQTLAYSGTAESTEVETVTETLGFWPKGDRTFVWTFGNYSSSYILYLENFQVVNAHGSVYLKNANSQETANP